MHRSTQALIAGALALGFAWPARAGANDLALWRLGNPDPITVCTLCDGTDGTRVPGDPGAQVRFARLTAALGLAFIPPFSEAAGSLGQAGFEVGFAGQVAFPRLSPDEWATEGTRAASPAPRALFLPALRLRKGLGGSLELGTVVSYLAGSQIAALTFEVRFSPLDGLADAPDVAVRAYGTRVVGAESLDLTVGGVDLALSRTFAFAGVARLQPYGQAGIAFVDAASGVVDFRPATENPKNPRADDGAFRPVKFFQNRYFRGTLGLRLLAGAAEVGVEGGLSMGSNPVQSGALAGGAPVPTQFTRLWTASAHLGLAY
ncbi:MAG: hypothetical protein NVS4B10_23580 [Myxococcales bacterium]